MAGAIRIYQLFLSPVIPPCCRYSPTCSEYTLAAVLRHGAFLGGILGLARLLRCAPWGGYGYDPVPDRFRLFGKRDAAR